MIDLKRESVLPKNKKHWLELRKPNINSTEIAALFGISPYITEYELWHQKHDKVYPEFKENERMDWGSRLQDAIAKGIAEDQGWKVEPMKEYFMVQAHRLGSSFDWKFKDGKGILEIKNVDGRAFSEGWLVDDDGNVEAPPHIEIQIQQELLVSGREYAYIGALVGGNKGVPIRREEDHAVQEAILKKVDAFWKSVDEHKEPAPDFQRDAHFIASLYKKASKGKVLDALDRQDLTILAREYQSAQEAEKVAKIAKEGAKAKLLVAIGDCEKVVGDKWGLTASEVPESKVEAFTKKAYRIFKLTFQKEK